MPLRPSLLPEGIDFPISIVGTAALSALGEDIESNCEAIRQGRSGIRPLGELLGHDSPHAGRPGAWIAARHLLTHRKWSPVSMAAWLVAREALSRAGWSLRETEDAALIVGTSRGNAAGWLGPWPGRRPFKLMAASNTIHSEPATAVSIECGIRGPNHVVASGCSAGLDALGIARMMLLGGMVRRALVVAVDLPLVPMLLDGYAASGLLSENPYCDPYHPASNGFVPAEGAAAMALEKGEASGVGLLHYSNNADAADPVGVPTDGGATPRLLRAAIGACGPPAAICPHATGTRVQARAERIFFGESSGPGAPTFHLLKPYLGHTVGASGLLESVILARFLAEGNLPQNLPGLASPDGWRLPTESVPVSGPVFKLAHGMGGHNAVAVFQHIP